MNKESRRASEQYEDEVREIRILELAGAGRNALVVEFALPTKIIIITIIFEYV